MSRKTFNTQNKKNLHTKPLSALSILDLLLTTDTTTSSVNGYTSAFYCTLTLYGRTEPDSNGPYSNTVIGTLTVDGWAVTFCTARRGLGHIIRSGTIMPLYSRGLNTQYRIVSSFDTKSESTTKLS